MPQKSFRESRYFPLTAAALLLAVSVLMPQIFHSFGPAGGKMFLPMHFGVLLAGLYLGPWWGLAIGTMSPLLSFLLTGMPPAAMLPFMCAELAAYGLFAGIFSRALLRGQNSSKCRLVYPALILAQIAGRLVSAGVLFLCGDVIGLQGAAKAASVWTATLAGVWGIVIQLAVLPPVFMLINKILPPADKRKK
ncbi:MAG: ECF transporter S component [Oscillospiraceae bacterium]|jgi:niacin transporter|nr:ECF transporter S component [Oscillospiraceae bacterium]